jgi:hypothetical protein
MYEERETFEPANLSIVAIRSPDSVRDVFNFILPSYYQGRIMTITGARALPQCGTIGRDGEPRRDQDRDLGLPVLWMWLIRRANKVVLDAPIPTRHFALLNHRSVDVVQLCPIHQCGRCLHERVIWSAMDHGRKGASWDLRGAHNSISRQGGCSDRDPHVNVDLAGTVVNVWRTPAYRCASRIVIVGCTRPTPIVNVACRPSRARVL